MTALGRSGAWALALATAVSVQSPTRLCAQAIAKIEIERHDVFTGAVARTFYGQLANTLHITTRDAAIRREILLHPGEPYDSALAAEGARNLRRLGVFRSVRVDTMTTDSGFVLKYTTDDGWSTKADFRFGSTGHEVTWTLAAYEDNLLGTAGQLEFLHKKTPDRTTNTFLFQRSRLFANKVYLRTEYIDQSDGWQAAGFVGVPWLSTRSRGRVFLSVLGRNDRVLQFRDGIRTAADSLRRVETVVRGDVGYAITADPHHYLRVGALAQYHLAEFGPWPATTTVSRSEVGEMQAWVEQSRARFLVLQGFRTFAHQEDIDLSTTGRLGVAYAPRAFGEVDGVGPVVALHSGIALGPASFLTGDIRYDGLYHGTAYRAADSSSALIATSAGWVLGRRHVVVAHGEAGARTGVAPGDEYDLGLGVGPRAYPSHAFTGDRQFLLTTEYRFTADPDLWGLMGFGVAAFIDHGGAWYDGDKVRSGTDAGVGIRLGPSRATSLAVLRVDVARRFATDRQTAGWVLVIGKGFVFTEPN